MALVTGEKYHKEIESGKLIIEHRKHINRSLLKHGRIMQEKLRNVITTGSRTGRTYIINGKIHQASSPGEPPANLSGNLANSFKYTRKGMNTLTITNTAKNNGFKYPYALEKGTKKIAPRPYMKITNEKFDIELLRDLQNFRKK